MVCVTATVPPARDGGRPGGDGNLRADIDDRGDAVGGDQTGFGDHVNFADILVQTK